MNPPTPVSGLPTTPSATPFNGGGPLTQNQIQQARTQAGINSNPNTATATIPVSQRLSELQAGTYGAGSIPSTTVPQQGSILNSDSTWSAPDLETPGKNVITGVENAANRAQTNFGKGTVEGVAEGEGNLYEGGLSTLAGVAEGAGNIMSSMLPNQLKSWLFQGNTNPDDTSAGALTKAVINKIGQLSQTHPEAATDINNLAQVALLALGGEGEKAGSSAMDDLSKGKPDVTASNPANADELNKSAVTANKIINPDNVVRQEDVNKMSDVDANGQLNSEQKGSTKYTKTTQLRPEVMAQDPNNQLVRELMDKGVVSPDNTHVENIGGVKGELQDEGNNLRTFLNQPHNDIPVKYSDLEANVNKAYNDFAKENDIEPGSAEDKKAQAIKNKYLKEISTAYKAQPAESAGTASGTKAGIESFNKKMESQLGTGIYDDTPEGRTQLKMAQLARKSGYDTIQETLNNFDNESIKSNAFGKDAQALAERAKTFNSKQGFIDQMMSEGSNSSAESSMHAREGTANPKTAASSVSESGLNVNPRSPINGGTHGIGYTTTPEEDLGEIYDMAHEGINSTKGDAFKASLQRQAKLYDLRDEMLSRTSVNTPRSALEKLLNSPKGYALRRIARVGGTGASLGFGTTELFNR